MGNSVFILGAGASVHANAPVMREFLDQAAIVGRSEKGTPDQEAFEIVSRARSELQLVHSKARFDLRNLESVFAAFEMAQLFGRLGKVEQRDVSRLVASMQRVIVRTLEVSMRFQVKAGAVQPPDMYNEFARSLYEVAGTGEHITVITFNYDIGVDFALSTHFSEIDYCFNHLPVISERPIESMKLHGSLNWSVCPSCEKIGFDPVDQFVDRLERGAKVGGNRPVLLEVSKALQSLKHLNCSSVYRADPVIVPPTTAKMGYQQQLAPVWARAAERLAQADSIYVIGYSWPLGDQFFHQLFAVGSVGEQLLRRFCVVNPEQTVRERFRNELLGQQGIDRFAVVDASHGRFQHEAINTIRRHYGLANIDTVVPRTRRSM